MFIDFFYFLRSHGIKVSVTEWMTLMEALGRDLSGTSLMRFYHLCRAICVKRESQYDLYDQCFASFFQDAEAPEALSEQLLDWLSSPIPPPDLSPEEREQLEALDLERLRELFEQRLKEQKERHDGGSRWIGTGGTSPFGQGGQNPAGIRVGGEGGGRSAIQVASKRLFRNLRHDVVLDTRSIGVALRQLRQLRRDGAQDELDLDETIDETAKNAGDIEIVFRAPRKNTVKLLLLMDVGGSMTPYTHLCERLFSAAHAANHFKAFRFYYFHNCPYERLYQDISLMKGEETKHLLEQLDREWYCMIVGDAAMSPYELTSAGGAIDFFHNNPEPGLVWLQRIAERFPRSAWLNPDPLPYWDTTYTNRLIREIFSMFPLTVEGLEEAIQHIKHRVV